MDRVLLSTGKDDWETPADLFAELHREFDFTIDAAASDTNHKLPKYYTQETDGLAQSWEREREYSATLHTAERLRRTPDRRPGSRRHTESRRRAPSWSCSCLPEQTQRPFTDTYCHTQRSGSLRVGSVLKQTEPLTMLHRFRQCSPYSDRRRRVKSGCFKI